MSSSEIWQCGLARVCRGLGEQGTRRRGGKGGGGRCKTAGVGETLSFASVLLVIWCVRKLLATIQECLASGYIHST